MTTHLGAVVGYLGDLLGHVFHHIGINAYLASAKHLTAEFEHHALETAAVGYAFDLVVHETVLPYVDPLARFV